jgi:hypothetical protein
MNKNNSVFKLIAYTICEETDEEGYYKAPSYPSFGIENKELGLYSSLENAEARMTKHIAELKQEDERLLGNDWHRTVSGFLLWHEPEEEGMVLDVDPNGHISFAAVKVSEYASLYCFFIEEYRLDDGRFIYAATRRAYAPDGKLLETSLVADVVDCPVEIFWTTDLRELAQYGVFGGKEPGENCFKVGDLIEVFKHDRIDLRVITSLPKTPSRMRELKEILSENMTDNEYPYIRPHRWAWFGNISDSYHCIDLEGCDSICRPVEAFAPRFPIPDELKKEILEAWSNKRKKKK